MPSFPRILAQAGLRPSIACALLLLTGACATGSSPSFTMAPIFFSETVDGSDGSLPGAPASDATGTAIVVAANDLGRMAPAPQFLIAGGNALLPTGSATGGGGIQAVTTIPTPLLTAQPGLVLASLGPASVAVSVPPGVVTGGVGLVSATIGAPIVDGVASIAAPVIASVANIATTTTATIVAPLTAPVTAIVSPVTAVANPIVTQLTNPVTTIAAPVTATATTAVAQVVTTAVPAINAPVAAVSPITAPVVTAAASVAAPLAPIVAALPVAGQRLAIDQTVLPTQLRTGAAVPGALNDTMALAIRTCLLGGCR